MEESCNRSTAVDEIKLRSSRAGSDFPDRVLTDMSSGVLVISSKGRILYLNPPAERMLEFENAGAPGEVHFSGITAYRGNDEFTDYILNAIQNKDITHTGTVHYTARSGRKYVFRISSSYLSSKGENPGGEIVITFSDETQAAEMHRRYIDASRCFTIAITAVCIWMLIYALWEMMGRPVSVDYLTHGSEALGLLMLVPIFCFTSFTFQDMGIVSEEPKKTVAVALGVSAASVAFLVLFKLGARWVNPLAFEPDAPFIDFSRFTWHQLAYILTAGLQEFIARSVIQNNIRRIMVGRHPAVFAILLSSLIFAALHIQHGFFFMVGAAVLAGLEGILYEKQRSLIGVWIVHWVFGVAGALLCLITVTH